MGGFIQQSYCLPDMFRQPKKGLLYLVKTASLLLMNATGRVFERSNPEDITVNTGNVHPVRAWTTSWKGQTDRQTGRQADRQTGRQADRQTDRQADRQAYRQAGRQTSQSRQRLVTPPYLPPKSFSCIHCSDV